MCCRVRKFPSVLSSLKWSQRLNVNSYNWGLKDLKDFFVTLSLEFDARKNLKNAKKPNPLADNLLTT